MLVGVEPTIDYAFKHTFGRETTRPILIHAIDSILEPSPEHRILDIDLINPFNPKETPDDKLSILDIKARDHTGRQFDVEMQMLAVAFLAKRIFYYLCKLHQQQLLEGDSYELLRPTISIVFLNDVLFPKIPDHHLRFRLLEQTHHIPLTDNVEFHILELPKFSKQLADLVSPKDKWLYFLRHAAKINTGDVPDVLKQEPMIVRALEELAMLTQNEVERERYESRRKAYLDRMSEREEMRLAGLVAGRVEGRAEGRVEGRKEQLIESIHFCERLMRRPETTADTLAGLSLDELTRLAKDLQGQIEQKT